MTPNETIKELISAAEKLLLSRYKDGECDSFSVSEFESAVNDIKQKLGAEYECKHSRIITKPGDETFLPQRGCLDCNKWLDPVRLRKPK